jgi:large subunit ribosomal protein L23|tara:strand:- start:715 stop:1008 length:294 start_codon:yes stop_codon:yes gene_type:complete
MKKINYLDSIHSPLITEKASGMSEQNKVIFKVHENASKKTIKKNIEKIFKVKVIKINTINKKSKSKIIRGKQGFKKGFKKAVVTLKKGQTIDLATGV